MSKSRKYSLLESVIFAARGYNTSRLKNQVDGKTILITGASRGIGKALCQILSECNCTILGIARTQEDLDVLAQDLREKKATLYTYAIDLRNAESRLSMYEWIANLQSTPDIIVHNAGKSIRRSLLDAKDRFHDYERTMDLNYFAPVDITLRYLNELITNKGQVISISTVSVRMLPAAKWTAYQASKGAFDQWMRSAAPELIANGVACTSIYPPLVKTDMIAPTKAYDKMPAMKPEHLARVIARKMYTRSAMYRPWWCVFGEIASVLFAKTGMYFMSKHQKKV